MYLIEACEGDHPTQTGMCRADPQVVAAEAAVPQEAEAPQVAVAAVPQAAAAVVPQVAAAVAVAVAVAAVAAAADTARRNQIVLSVSTQGPCLWALLSLHQQMDLEGLPCASTHWDIP